MKSPDVRKCIRCGMEFTPSGNWRRRQNQISCTQQCRALYERSRVDAVIGQGKPLVTVYSDYVQCNICGETRANPGRHLQAAHLIAVGAGLTMSERQVIYGLSQGQRVLPEKYLVQMREHGLAAENQVRFARYRGLRRTGKIECPPHLVRAPLSASQIGNRKGRSKIVPIACKGCGKVFRPKYTARVYCSFNCRTHDPAFGEKIAQGKRQLADRACAICGTTFRPAKSRTKCCSYVCGSQLATQIRRSSRAARTALSKSSRTLLAQ